MRHSAPWWLACYKSVKEVIKPVNFFFCADVSALYITLYCTQVSINRELEVEREHTCRFCKKLLNPPQGKRLPVVLVFNRLKNKELLAVYGQESVVLAAEVES